MRVLMLADAYVLASKQAYTAFAWCCYICLVKSSKNVTRCWYRRAQHSLCCRCRCGQVIMQGVSRFLRPQSVIIMMIVTIVERGAVCRTASRARGHADSIPLSAHSRRLFISLTLRPQILCSLCLINCHWPARFQSTLTLAGVTQLWPTAVARHCVSECPDCPEIFFCLRVRYIFRIVPINGCGTSPTPDCCLLRAKVRPAAAGRPVR